ncbi:MAG: hypothetical protein NC123_08210 [Butyrivibrio sp.]|nr:hypothetical protein [Acetatifactor muris]MCM1559513.1 hypothetical protein [Butyrivibrio sp.]
MELLKKAAMLLYKRACILKLPFFRGKRVEADLALLHPGERVECVKTDYYVRKISMCIGILGVGAFLGLAAKLSAGGNKLAEEAVISRGSYEEGSRQVALEADDGEGKRRFEITVSPRTLTFRETEELAETLFESLETLILNGNEDTGHIISDLKLEEEYAGFPFEVEWESGREAIVDRSGRVWEVDDPVEVKLYATLKYREFSRKGEIDVTVVPVCLTPEEQDYLEMQEYLVAEEAGSRGEAGFTLPGEWKGKEISWSLAAGDYSLLIWAVTPAVAFLVYLSSDRDLRKELEKKHSGLSREYPDLVHKLALYVGAGMTIRGAFQKIGGDYEKKLQKGQPVKPGCEAVLYTCRELQTGVAEGAAYEHFGRRTGLREYIRLSTLLGQNLKRGNSTLLERLREEAEKSSEESLLRVKKLGEEAGTKLLAPMVLMLAIVMVMIMIPAFGSI